MTKETFFQLLAIIRIADAQRHRLGGRPGRIPLENKLLWTLQYWREYRTIEHLAYEYNTVVSHIHDEIDWIENALIEDGAFCLQGKEVLQNYTNTPYQTVAVDETEHPVERPKKNKKIGIAARKDNIRLKTNWLSVL
ncbi:MAG: transposase family protein [Planctomycetaceae bacterium]|nr:transposase family protein [Planctomycetaceae bacterium]